VGSYDDEIEAIRQNSIQNDLTRQYVTQVQGTGANTARNIETLLSDFPWLAMSPGITYALGVQGISGEAANGVAQAELQRQVQANPNAYEHKVTSRRKKKDKGGGLLDFITEPIGDLLTMESPIPGVTPIARGFFTGLQGGQDLVGARLRGVASGYAEAPWYTQFLYTNPLTAPLAADVGATVKGVSQGVEGKETLGEQVGGAITGAAQTALMPTIEQNTAGQVALALARGQEVDLGSGLFPDPESKIGKAQAEAAREYSPYLIGGHAWTPGRAVAGELFDPNTAPFTIMSGTLDAAVAIAADPAAAAFNKLGQANRARKLIAPTTEIRGATAPGFKWLRPQSAEELVALREGIRITAEGRRRVYTQGGTTISQDLFEQMGGVVGRRPLFSPNSAVSWLYGETGEALVQRIASTNNITNGSVAQIRWAFNNKIPVTLAQELAGTTDPSTIRVILARALGTEINKVPVWRNGTQLNRWLIDNPERIIDADNLDASLRNIEGVLVTAKVGVDDTVDADGNVVQGIRSILDNYIAADNAGYRYAAVNAVFDTLAAQLRSAGVDTATVKKMTQVIGQRRAEAARYWIDALTGDNVRIPVQVGNEIIEIDSPLMMMDRLRNNIVLPDARDLRALINSANWISTVKGSGLVRTGGAIGDFFISGVWKPFVLLRPAWTVRVVGEEMFRIAVGGSGGFFRHPISYISAIVGDSEVSNYTRFVMRLTDRNAPMRDAMLDYYRGLRNPSAEETTFLRFLEREAETPGITNWTEWKRRLGAAGDDVLGETFDRDDEEGLGAATNNLFRGLQTETRRPVGSGGYVAIDAANNPEAPRALLEEIRRFNADPEVRRALSSTMEEFRAWGRTAEGLERRRALAAGRRSEDPLSALADDDAVFDSWVERVVYSRLEDFTQGNSEILFAIRNGRRTSDGIRLFDRNGESTRAARNWANDLLQDPNQPTPAFIKAHQSIVKVGDRNQMTWLNNAVRTMFDTLGAKPTNFLNRSPEYRIKYWSEIENMAGSLSPQAKTRLLRNLDSGEIGRLMPGQRNRLRSVLSGEGQGSLSLADADRLAKQRSLDHVEGLLYTMSKKNQTADAMRLAFPFAEAWKEVITTWGRLISEYPQTLPRFQQVYTGMRESEFDPITGLPVGSGEGFIHFDDRTNQEVFTYPGSALASKFLTGVPMPLTGSVQGLNMIGTGIPALGPAVSLPTSWILPDKPKYDQLRNVLFPYGVPEKASDFFTPAWARTMLRAVTASTNDRVYMNTIFDVARYLQSTGEYDIQGDNANEEMVRLLDDAKSKGRWLWAIRAMGQSTLPSSPAFDPLVKDPEGNLVMLQKVIEDYQKIQKRTRKEGGSGGDAFDKFLEKWGVDNLLVTQSKSSREIPGLTSNKEQRDWARANPDLVDRYPRIWALYAPEGSQHDQTAYDAQLEEGLRDPLLGQGGLERIRRANDKLATHLYRRAREALLNENMRASERADRLRQLKVELLRDYPGYSETPFARDNEALIVQLEQSLADPQLMKTQAGRGLAEYFVLRAQAQAGLARAGIAWPPASKAASAVRDALLRAGESLRNKYPAFGRMWDEVLQYEIDVE